MTNSNETYPVYDIGVKLPPDWTDSKWDDISQFLEDVLLVHGLEWESSGCGLGYRDAQLADHKNQEDLTDQIKERMSQWLLEGYVSRYIEGVEVEDES